MSKFRLKPRQGRPTGLPDRGRIPRGQRGPGVPAGIVRRGESGFSFLELVVVIALIGIIAGVITQVFVFGVDIFSDTVTRKDVLPSSRIAVGFMISDLRDINDSGSIAAASASALTFDNLEAETVSYSYAGGTLSRNSNVLLAGLSGFSFHYLNVDGDTLISPVSSPEDIWKIGFAIANSANGAPLSLASGVVPRAF